MNFFDWFFKVRDLIDAFCEQLKSPILENDLGEQVVKNLAFMAKIVYRYPATDDALIGHDINIEWLIKKVTREAKFELVNKPKESIKVKKKMFYWLKFQFYWWKSICFQRTHIFKWMAALGLDLGKESLKNYLYLIIPILQREMVLGQPSKNSIWQFSKMRNFED